MRLRNLLLATLLSGLGMGLAIACSIPVFRYALEHWQPDPYTLRVIHRGPLSGPDQQLVQRWQQRMLEELPVNARWELVPWEAAGESPAGGMASLAPGESWLQVLLPAGRTSLPPASVISPPQGDAPGSDIVWQGRLTDGDLERVIDSPARQQMVDALTSGTSIVWVLVDGADAEQNQRLERLLVEQLQRLEALLELPEIEADDLAQLSGPAESLQLKMSTLRIARDDPLEAFTREMFLSVEADLREPDLVDLPMAFPVFGRGRALYALVGEGINAGLIEEACRFLTGACQCTVKTENPGVDLLCVADWDALVSVAPPTEVEVNLTGLAAFAEPRPAVPASTGPAAEVSGLNGGSDVAAVAPTGGAAPSESSGASAPSETGTAAALGDQDSLAAGSPGDEPAISARRESPLGVTVGLLALVGVGVLLVSWLLRGGR
jgi:hypothetical protein